MNDIIKAKVKAYKDEFGCHPTEAELVGHQPVNERKQFTKALLQDFEHLVFDDDNLELKPYVQPVATKAKSSYPITEKLLIQRIIRPLICTELQTDRVNESECRDRERMQIVEWLNIITAELLADGKWDPKPKRTDESGATIRARQFFYGGAIRWWMERLFIQSVRGSLFTDLAWEKRFTAELTDVQKEKIPKILRTLCQWTVWSEQGEDVVKAWRSNTVRNVVLALPDWDHLRLLEDAG
jgi:hypothetical protein